MSSRTPSDEIRYCERCGISFLWSAEEQRRAASGQPPPEHCRGCQALLPQPGRERGQVKWYNIRKRYGFIVRAHHDDLHVSASALRGTRFLKTGDLVEFAVDANAEGPTAVAVAVKGER